jgi:NADPH:quinone reductase-like Zn-dependent oxidoreductase
MDRVAMGSLQARPSDTRRSVKSVVYAGPGQVRIRVHAATVNPTDVAARNGARAEQQKADPPPYVPGMEVAGKRWLQST